MYIKETVKPIVKKPAIDTAEAGKDPETTLEVDIVFQDDNKKTLPQFVLGYDIIPEVGSSYKHQGVTDNRFVLTKRIAEPITIGLTHWWKVALTYQMLGGPDDETDPNPEDLTGVTIRRCAVKIPTVATRDALGNPLLNSAGLPFDPPIQYDRYVRGFTITRTEYLNPYSKADYYENAVNSISMWAFPPGTVLIHKIDPVLNAPRNQERYSWNVTYDILIDTDIHGLDPYGQPIFGHDIAVLDNGTRFRGTDGLLYPILDDSGLDIEKPERLNGFGQPLAYNAPSVYLRFARYHAANLNALLLPNPYVVGIWY